MNILYVHGFGSKYNPRNHKVIQLQKLGEVNGVNIDYTKPEQIPGIMEFAIHDYEVDLLVGTSMGGYLAARYGALYGIPYVAINPSHTPQESMSKYLGKNVDLNGNEYELTQEAIDCYPPIETGGYGLVILDRGDEAIDPERTIEVFRGEQPVMCHDGGSHQFDHMKESLDEIKSFYNRSQVSYDV